MNESQTFEWHGVMGCMPVSLSPDDRAAMAEEVIAADDDKIIADQQIRAELIAWIRQAIPWVRKAIPLARGASVTILVIDGERLLREYGWDKK